MKSIQYTVVNIDPCLHRVDMRLIFSPSASHSIIGMPNWIPGSYKIRDFAKNMIALSAVADGVAIECEAIDKHRWSIHAEAKKIEVTYSVYTKDISVRTAYLDDQMFFFNLSSLCLYIEGEENTSCLFTLHAPKHPACKSWTVDTGMPHQKLDARKFGVYKADNYDALIDHPFLIGRLHTIKFKAHGVAHRISLVGASAFDHERLAHDLKKICEAQIHLFGGSPVKKEYVFLTWVVGNGYGGLEHRNSTALITSRESLPYEQMPKEYQPYAEFLSLCSHEYFHTWHVKSTKPEAFMPYDLSKENYTRQLWIFEGFTSYYEDIILLRAGLISESQYRTMFAQKITSVERNPGYLVQSAADSSHSTWIKFYDPNENSPNVTVSYYTKGALIAWGLDVMLRRGGQYTLDDLVKYLWKTYGAQSIGVPENTVEKIILEWGGKKLAKALHAWVNGVEPLPLLAWAKASGWTLTHTSDNVDCHVELGVRLSSDGRNTVSVCLDHGAAQLAGISAGDELIAINGIALRGKSLSDSLKRFQPKDAITVHVIRGDILLAYVVTLQAAKPAKVVLSI